MDTALPQKFPFILDRNLAKANCTGNRVCTSCDIVVLDTYLYVFVRHIIYIRVCIHIYIYKMCVHISGLVTVTKEPIHGCFLLVTTVCEPVTAIPA